MQDYIGGTCPLCKAEIKESDTVEICPSCGIPYHEVCWEENGGCSTCGCKEERYEEQCAKQMNLCPNCGASLVDGQAFCPMCGASTSGEKHICSKCGAELQQGQDFCPKCGTKANSYTEAGDFLGTTVDDCKKTKKNAKKRKLILILAGAVIVVVGLVLSFVLRSGVSVSEVALNRDFFTITEGEAVTLVCTVTPDNAKDKRIRWKSSDEAVASVDEDGKVTAVSEGVCTITATTSNGKTDECRIIVEKAGPDFKSIYSEYCDSTWATLGYDGSYLSIDTNPYDIDDYFDYDAYAAIYIINGLLGLPDSLLEDMGHTTALMGRQSETFDSLGITVSWSYHPDNGLQVTYKAINK